LALKDNIRGNIEVTCGQFVIFSDRPGPDRTGPWDNACLTTPALKIVPSNHLELAVWEWEGAGPAIVFAHATGFHGRCWDQIIRMFPGRRAVAVDFRGHGRSSKPQPPYPWTEFGRDLAAVGAALNLGNAIGVGHSMGGHSIVEAALLRPETFGALLLVDPTIFPREYYGQPSFDVAFIRRRRNRWKSPEEMFERFRTRPPFASWREEVLRDYCEFGLLQKDGEFELACPPDVEASIYEQSTAAASDLYQGIPSIQQPVVIMRASTLLTLAVFELSASPTAPDLAARFPRGRDLPLADRSHYIPMESPDLVAEEIARLQV
jgi:lipase